MKILVLGGDGMLGHQLFKQLKKNHEVKVTLRQALPVYKLYSLFQPEYVYPGVDVRSTERLSTALNDFTPHAVINAVGVIKQQPAANEYIPSIEINSLFPHRLAKLCSSVKARMIHLSTDCVFSGKKGMYNEQDVPDPVDLYGRSKLLGEVDAENCLTLRTSMVGPELSRKKSLLEWFLSQEGSVKGFKRAIFSGFTTIELSRIIEQIIVDYPRFNGIYHVSAEPISKFSLLSLIKDYLSLSIIIEPDKEFACDRSLDSTRFRSQFGYTPPSWESMVDELCRDILRLKR